MISMFLSAPWLFKKTANAQVDAPNKTIRESSLTPTHLFAKLKQKVELPDFSKAAMYWSVK